MILVLSVGLVVLYVDNKRTRECIANYMVADQENTAARISFNDQERAAFNHLLVVLRDIKTPQAERTKAYDDYVALVLKNDELRRQRPPLPVPTECD